MGVITPNTSHWEVKDALDELELLADTAGAQVVGRLTQNLQRINAATYIGKGKVTELKALVQAQKADLVIFDDDLSTVQLRNIEKAIECKLLDRSGLILDIFASRAKTSTAKTQVELAQLDYMMTRLTRQWTHLSRQKGGIGTKGPGETQIETDRRLIGKRMAVLRKRLQHIDRQRVTQRKRRGDLVQVALVGYTNAGKSTLMNALAHTKVLAEDRLFATLDATTRQIHLETNKPILLTDTVGFIRKLPHRLIESFKSTLDEVRESDILLHVVDAGHPHYEDHMRVVKQTLAELGSQEKPILLVFNKVDALPDKGILVPLREQYPDAAFISGLRGIGLNALKQRLLKYIEQDYVEQIAYVPVTEAKLLAYMHKVSDVLDETYLSGINTETHEEQAMVQIHFRISNKYYAEIDRALKRLVNWQPLLEATQ